MIVLVFILLLVFVVISLPVTGVALMLGLQAVMAIGGILHGTLLAAYTYIIIYINNISQFYAQKKGGILE